MDLTAYVHHFQRRVLMDAVNEATSSYWRRRAETFAAVGNARCDEIAVACRNRASVALIPDGIEPEVVEALREES
jgi:hypothetical protein